MTNTAGHILIGWIHDPDHCSVDASGQALVAHINFVNISDSEPDDILSICTSICSKCILSISENNIYHSHPESLGMAYIWLQ